MRNLFQIGADCNDLIPLISVVKKGVMPLFQILIPIALIVWGTIDLGKAVISSDDSEIKKAQKLLIKRFIYAAAVFFVVVLVNLLMSIVAAGSVEGTGSWSECWNAVN